MRSFAQHESCTCYRDLPWRVLGFVVTFTALQLAWQSVRGTSVEYFVIHSCTVQPAALLADLLTPDLHARAVGFSLQAPRGGLNILNGCEGLGALFLLAAAFMAASLTWRSRLAGLALGAPVIFFVNEARILLLFYVYRADPALFDSLHAIITPVVLVVLVCCYFHVWLAHAGNPAADTA